MTYRCQTPTVTHLLDNNELKIVEGLPSKTRRNARRLTVLLPVAEVCGRGWLINDLADHLQIAE